MTSAVAVLALGGMAMAAPMPPPEVRAETAPDGTVVKLVNSYGRKGSARLLVGGGKAATLAQGESAGTIVVGHGRVVVALAVDHAGEPFHIHVVDGGAAGKAVAVARPVARHDYPFAVAGAVTPDGFAIFFQEVQGDDPTAAHTYLVKLDDQGAPVGAAVEVPVPWSLAAAAWNGNGYHLALLFPGYGDGMRLSMVSITAAGQPQQHPDWASAAGYIGDVHLVAADGKVRAFYRGGAGGDRLLESDVSAIGNWGTEPAKARDHGGLPGSKAIAIADDKPRAVDRPR
ncbi:MAG TPA: hypothetical protein VL172_22915 [Kofleriaceae bacterium]|nr:hypothetical protein [Kofleriaceae bacterium]